MCHQRGRLLTHVASPDFRDLQAISTADRLLEHAVLQCMLGPCRSKYQLTRFGIIHATVQPVTAVRSVLSGSIADILIASSSMEAENTAVREPLRLSTDIPAVVVEVSFCSALVSNIAGLSSHLSRRRDRMSPKSTSAWDP